MPNPFSGGGSTRKNPFLAEPSSGEDRGVVDFVGNLAGDVKDMAVGLPMGVIETVRNPIKSVKAMGGATWQTWSPLAKGDFGTFGKQLYDHPLAPLLDVATVFTLGAGGAVKGASALSKAGVQSSKVEKVAALGRAKKVTLYGPKGGKLPVDRHLSTRAGRRLFQEAGMLAPQWYVKRRNDMRFANLDRVRDAGLVKATHESQMAAVLQAGKVVTDPDTAPRALQEIAGGMYAGLLRHNPAVDAAEAERLVKGGKYAYTVDVRYLDRQTERLLRRARREEGTWQRQRAENAEKAHALPKIEKELAEANRELQRMYREGYRVAGTVPGHGASSGAAGRGRLHVDFTETSDYAGFNAAIRENPRAQFIAEHSPDELAGGRVFLSGDRKAGYVISPEGDLQNVFRNPGGKPGAGRAAVEHAVAQGAKTLDAYEGPLTEMYAQHGFREVGRMKFVDEFAPEGWDFEQYGRPDIVFMAHSARAKKGRYFTDWDEAKRVSLEAAGKRPSKKKDPTPKQLMELEAAPILEVERRVRDIEKQLERAHKAKAKHDKAVQEIERLTEWRTAAERRGYADYFRHVSGSLEDFVAFSDSFGNRISTRIAQRAARPKVIQDGRWVDDTSRVYIHRKHDVEMLGREAAASASFLGKAYRNTSSLWKTVTLGYSPRTVTNNTIGNWLIAASRDNPAAAAIGLYDAIRITKGDEAALQSTLRATPFRKNHWMYRYFADELGNTFKQTLADETGRLPGKLRQGVYPLVGKLSDEPVRMAVISAYLRNSPEVKALKKQGLSTDAAIHRALRKNRALREQASHHARTTAGDYYTLRPFERTLRDLMPFYLWNRHILKTTGNMVADTPGRVAIAQRLSSLGIERTEEILGELPEFLHGAIPLGKKGDRADVALTSSLNPFAAVADLVSFGEGLTTGGGVRGGAATLSQLNPLLTGGIEAATGRSILTGAEKPGYGGIVPTLAVNTALGFPQARLGQALISPDTDETEAGNPTLYAKDDRSPLTSFLGIPIRNLSLEQAEAMAEREKPKRRKKRRRNPFQQP